MVSGALSAAQIRPLEGFNTLDETAVEDSDLVDDLPR